MNKEKRFLGFYATFRPKLQVLQIICQQIAFYLSLFLLAQILDQVLGYYPHVGQILHMNAFNMSGNYFYINLLIHISNSILTVFSLTLFIEKASKVFDHIVSLFIIHWIFCIIYSKAIFVSNWYLLNFIVTWICIVAGRWMCLFFEQNNINAFEGIIDNTKMSVSANKVEKNQDQSFNVIANSP